VADVASVDPGLRPLKGTVSMKLTLNILGGVLAVLGVVWILQGVNILPGSFMTGQIRWAVYGAIALAVGVVLLVAALRIDKPRSTR
jgi:uncharacterized membrane protein HdeD (DUF308 family)